MTPVLLLIDSPLGRPAALYVSAGPSTSAKAAAVATLMPLAASTFARGGSDPTRVGASLTAVIVIGTIALDVPPRPSLIV